MKTKDLIIIIRDKDCLAMAVNSTSIIERKNQFSQKSGEKIILDAEEEYILNGTSNYGKRWWSNSITAKAFYIERWGRFDSIYEYRNGTWYKNGNIFYAPQTPNTVSGMYLTTNRFATL